MAKTEEKVFITSPLETETVARIEAEAPAGVRVAFEPDLFPPVRYAADHKGTDGFFLNTEQMRRWRENLDRATILWDFPGGLPEDGGGLAHAPNVRWVQTTSSGVGQMIRRLGLLDHPVLVTTARGVHAGPLAEFALMAVLVHIKRLFELQRAQQARRWECYCGHDLPGRTMTVVGAGMVGAEVGRLSRAFGMKVIAVVNRPAPGRAAEVNADEVVGTDELGSALARSDFVTLCLPHTPHTENIMDADMIARMKPDAALINIARGQVVDEEALIAALQDRRIAFAALDVVRVEPLDPTSPLWSLPNVLISPHSASTVAGENAKIADIFIENLHHYVTGAPERMRNVLDKHRFY